ncbi:MAG: Na/Pi cotransporter family protein [Lachnospiraceae bacterium]|nr:Na/Pi cotransporter family protein [Lachnospiraceae bacterium]MDD3661222.1 Na/Pi cotransporter family protein [Lachnospiraceae bacterium]
MTKDDLEMILKFIGGLGMFLYGMNVMADGLQKSAGGRLKKLMEFLTKNRVVAILAGAAITGIIQSSSATTVMVVGFVNAGVMNLTQAVGVIMGANIGTTVTAWLVSMNEWGSMLKPEFFAPALLGLGAFLILFSSHESKKKAGEILVGFGILFIGLSFMSGSVAPYRDSPIFTNAFVVLGKNPFLAILVGTVVTGIIQSSSASVGILQTLAMNGIVSWQSAVFITLGQNIGTCVTAIISSAGAGKNAKRASMIHLLFNMAGAVIFGAIMYVVFLFNASWAAEKISSVQISIFHTIFNVSCTIILFPFADLLVKMSGWIIGEEKMPEMETKPDIVASVARHLDRRILENPSFALETALKEVNYMGEITFANTRAAIEAVQTADKILIDEVLEREQVINQLEKMLMTFLVEVDNLSLTEEQHIVIKNLFYTISDLERVSDHCENIVQLAEVRRRDKISFSKRGITDLDEIASETLRSLEWALIARKEHDKSASTMTDDFETKVDLLEEEMRERHIQRLSKGKCVPESGVIFLDILSNLERISDHAKNIAGYVVTER